MKNLLLLKKLIILNALLLVSMSGISQTFDVPQSKKALLFKSTANWCGPCGYYHYVTDSIYNNHGDSLLFLNGHVATSSVGDAFSGPMHNLLNGGGGIPAFSVSGHHLSDMWPPTYDEILDYARNTFYTEPIKANIAFDYTVSGNSIEVQTTTKIFEDFTTDVLYVGAMVVENNIIVNQKVDDQYEDQLQHRIQRTVLGNEISVSSGGKLWADQIATGALTAGEYFDHTLTGTIDPSWNLSELEVIVVVWARNGDVFSALSCEDVPYISASSYEITFNVHNINTSAPIENATITIDGGDYFSNEEGVALVSLENGDYNWTANATNYVEETGSITIFGSAETVNIEMEPNPMPITYEVIYSIADGEGTISATVNNNPIESGDLVEEGSTIEFQATPAESFLIYDWLLNDVSTGLTNTLYTVGNLNENIDVKVKFEPDGISNIDNIKTSIYPNPSKGLVNINIEGEYRLIITDIAGNNVFEGKLKGMNTIDLAILPEGIYFLKIQKGNKIESHSLIVN